MKAQRKTWLENARKHAGKCNEECGKMPGNMLANTRKNAENYYGNDEDIKKHPEKE